MKKDPFMINGPFYYYCSLSQVSVKNDKAYLTNFTFSDLL